MLKSMNSANGSLGGQGAGLYMMWAGLTYINAQIQQVFDNVDHSTGGSGVKGTVGFLILTANLSAVRHQKLHHLQMTCDRQRQRKS